MSSADSPFTRPAVVVLGAGGRLGATLVRAWEEDFTLYGFTRQQLDITDAVAVREAFQRWTAAGVRAVVNASGVTSLEAAEADPARAWQVNAQAVDFLVQLCRDSGMRFIHFSTDYVFDGLARRPYREDDSALPLSVYGQSKLAGERAVLAGGGEHLVFRVAWVFGPGKPAFPDMILRRALAGEDISAIADKWACPTSAEEVAEWLRPVVRGDLAIGGLFHLCQAGVCTWWEYAVEALRVGRAMGLWDREIVPRRTLLQEMTGFTAVRPVYSALDTTKFTQATGLRPSPWPEALERYLRRHFRVES